MYDQGNLVGPAETATIFLYAPALLKSLISLQYTSCGAFDAAIGCFVQNNIPQSPAIKYTIYAYNMAFASWFGENTKYVSSYVGPSLLNPGTDALPATGLYKLYSIKFSILIH